MSILHRLRRSLHTRHLSTLLSPDPTKPLSSLAKSKTALSLIKSEKNPHTILQICRQASLTPLTHVDRLAFSLAVNRLAKFHHFEAIREYLDELKTRPDLKNERFFSHAIVLFGQADMLDHAIRTFKEIDEMGIARSVRSLNALMFAGVLVKNYKEVNRFYVEFPKMYGIERDLETYNTVIRSFCESGEAGSVYSVLAEMDRKGVNPNATTFTNWIAGFYKEEKFDEVEKVLELMRKHGVKPGLSVYNTRIKSLCMLRRSSEAKEMLDGMVRLGRKPNVVTYSQLIHGFCVEGKFEEAKALFVEMKRRGIEGDSNRYFTLVYFLCKSGDFDAALEIAKESMEKDRVPAFPTMKALVNGLVSISKVEEAKDLIKQIKEKFPNKIDNWNEVEAGLPQ